MRDNVLAIRATDCRGAPIPGPISNASVYDPFAAHADLAFSVANTVNLMQSHSSLLDGVLDDLERPFSVVQRRVFRLETLAWRRNIRVPDIGEDGCGVVCVVPDNPSTKLVG
jgi:hypothetical protein